MQVAGAFGLRSLFFAGQSSIACRNGTARPSWRVPTALLAGCALSLGAPALAQQTPPAPLPPPGPVAPTREEVEQPVTRPVEAGRRLSVEGGVERAPCALAAPEYANLRFTLNDVTFNNLRGLSPEDLRPAFAPFIGQDLPVAAICEIRDRAATILRQAGYVAAVEVPEQRIENGSIRFDVMMAKLVGIRIRGDAGRAEQLIAGYFERLTDQELFNAYEAERYLLLAGDLPGYTVRLVLRPAGTAEGEVIGEVFVVRTAAVVDLAVQNYGSRDLGRWGALVRGQYFGLTGLGDRTSLAFYTTADFEEQQTIQVAHDFRVGSEGLGFGGQLTYSWARPDFNDPQLNFRSRTLFATAEASYPFIRRQARTLRGSIGFDYVDQDVDFTDKLVNRDHLRVAYLRATYDAVGLTPRFTPIAPPWRVGLLAELRHGLDIFDATESCGPALVNCPAGTARPSRAEADASATLVRGSVYGEFRPDPRVTVAVGARGQYSGTPLLGFEEFSAGNYSIGRGYDPGSIQGDSGVGVQAEFRYGNPYPANATAFAIQPFAFVDQAWSWNEDRLAPLPRQEVTSVGAGIRGAYGDKLRFELMVAIPLDRTLTQPDRDPRLLISVTTALWPWRFR